MVNAGISQPGLSPVGRSNQAIHMINIQNHSTAAPPPDLHDFLKNLQPGVRCRASIDRGTQLVLVSSIQSGVVTSFQTQVTVEPEDGSEPYAIAAGNLLRIEEVKARLVVDVLFDAGLESFEDLRLGLEQRARLAIDNGLLTGDSTALVEEYNWSAQVLSGPEADLSESDLESHFRARIESGNLSLEEIPRLLARLALSEPGDMRREFCERMEFVDEGSAT